MRCALSSHALRRRWCGARPTARRLELEQDDPEEEEQSDEELDEEGENPDGEEEREEEDPDEEEASEEQEDIATYKEARRLHMGGRCRDQNSRTMKRRMTQ